MLAILSLCEETLALKEYVHNQADFLATAKGVREAMARGFYHAGPDTVILAPSRI